MTVAPRLKKTSGANNLVQPVWREAPSWRHSLFPVTPRSDSRQLSPPSADRESLGRQRTATARPSAVDACMAAGTLKRD